MTEENCDPDGAIVRDGDTAVKKTFFTRLRAFFVFFGNVLRTFFQ